MHTKPAILCLEDNKDYLDLYDEWFSADYQVLQATTSPEAIGLLSTHDIRVAIVDISHVPNDPNHTGGFDFLERLRSIGLVPDVPTVIVTAYPNHMRKAFRDFGVSDFYNKDELERKELKKTVANLISQSYPAQVLGEAPRALVIEDDPEWSELLGDLLIREGCEVDHATTYSEAFDKLTSKSDRPYHIATVDIRLTNIESVDSHGLDLLDRMKRLGLPVDSIVITAAATQEQMRQAFTELPARDFFFKDEFRPERFRRRVRHLLTHLLFLNVTVGGNHGNLPLTVGSKDTLSVSITEKRPERGDSRTLARPTLTGAFELEVVVQPFDIDVYPGTTQFLSVSSDNRSAPVEFEVVPVRSGSIEILVDCFFRTNLVRRVVINRQASE